MHICFLSSLHPPLDKRVHYKEATTLVRKGFKVTHIAPGDNGKRVVEGVNQICFEGRKSVRGRLVQLSTLYRIARKVNADVYHCNEIESWTVGLILKFRKKVPVIFDVHEVYSTNVSERKFPKPIRPFVEWLVRLYFRCLLPFTDRLVFAKKTVQKDFPVRHGKTILVQNFTEINTDYNSSSRQKSANISAPASGRITALHLGAINRGRGWPQLLEAMRLVDDTSIAVSVVGRFGDGSENEFKSTLNKYGLKHKVDFIPWIPYDEVASYTASCHIGLIVFQPVHDNFINALPHKLFDYMLAGLPVIVPGFAVEVADIVERCECGILIDTTKPTNIAEALDRLARDDELRDRLGKNGRSAVLEHYNWEEEAKKLVAMYRELI